MACMISSMSESRELKGSGLKVTVPRLRVLDLFQHSNERHLTAELDLTRQLADRQRSEIDALRASVAAITERFDALVRHTMTRDGSIPPGATTP